MLNLLLTDKETGEGGPNSGQGLGSSLKRACIGVWKWVLNVRPKKWICFRCTGWASSIFFFLQPFSTRIKLFFSFTAIFGLFFPSITSFYAYPGDIRVQKDLRCQIWICHKKEWYFSRIIRLRTSIFYSKKYFCGCPGELFFRHLVRRKQTYYLFRTKQR